MKKNKKIKWRELQLYIVFIHGLYEQAGLTIPDEFYPEVEIIRLADALRLQAMGIHLPEITCHHIHQDRDIDWGQAEGQRVEDE